MRVTPVAPAVSVQKDKPYKSIEETIAEVKEVREVREVNPDVVADITWVQGFDKFVGELVHGRGYGQVK
jgi:hypothetical protein